MKKKSNLLKMTSIAMSTALLFACSSNNETGTVTTNNGAKVETESLSTLGDQSVSEVISGLVSFENEDAYSEWKKETYTSIQLNGTSASVDGSGGVQLSGNTIQIRTSGTYVISGKLTDGQIVVETDSKDKGLVRLVLNGAEITSSTSAPIYVKNAQKTVVSLPEGTTNILSDATKYVLEEDAEDEPNAALFSKDSLIINGTGTLQVHGNYNNGITGKDELKVDSGNIQIESVDDGLMGRDLLAVKDGTITINAGGDAMKSSNDKDASKGNIAILGGTFNLTSAKDGIQAETSLYINDGKFTVTSGGGSPETIANTNKGQMGKGQTQTTTTSTSTESMKGFKAGAELAIGGGSVQIDAADDALHSNNSMTITGGDMELAAGDDGIHANSSLVTKGGTIDITKSYEGVESKVVTVVDGTLRVNAADDGINIGGGNDGSGEIQTTAGDASLLMNLKGGYVYVNSQGDGLDSNGSIVMSGGTVVVNGPTESMNGALDFNQTFTQSGGLLVVAGSAGMAQAPTEESTQNSIAMQFPSVQKAGTLVHLEDSKGNAIATFAPEKDYQIAIISSPDLKKDSTYTLYSGGTATGENTDGLYLDGKYSGGSKVVEFKISDVITWLNESGTTEAPSGHGGGGFGGEKGGERPEGAGGRGAMFENLDDATREKVEAIMEKERNGEITREDAQAQMAELGVTFPNRP